MEEVNGQLCLLNEAVPFGDGKCGGHVPRPEHFGDGYEAGLIRSRDCFLLKQLLNL